MPTVCQQWKGARWELQWSGGRHHERSIFVRRSPSLYACARLSEWHARAAKASQRGLMPGMTLLHCSPSHPLTPVPVPVLYRHRGLPGLCTGYAGGLAPMVGLPGLCTDPFDIYHLCITLILLYRSKHNPGPALSGQGRVLVAHINGPRIERRSRTAKRVPLKATPSEGVRRFEGAGSGTYRMQLSRKHSRVPAHAGLGRKLGSSSRPLRGPTLPNI